MLLEAIILGTSAASYIIGYKIAKRGVKKGILEAYESIMADITSEETQSELRGVVKNMMGGVTTSVKQMFPKIKLQDAIGYLILQKFGNLGVGPEMMNPNPPQPRTPTRPIRPLKASTEGK